MRPCEVNVGDVITVPTWDIYSEGVYAVDPDTDWDGVIWVLVGNISTDKRRWLRLGAYEEVIKHL